MEEFFALLDDTGTSIFDKIYAACLKKREIIFNGEITSDVIERVAIPLLAFANDDKDEPVTLYLHSPGGSIDDAMFLCNIIDNYPKQLKVIVLGYACSMATFLLCAGAHNPNVTRYCYKFSYGLIHAGSIGIEGDANSVKEYMEFNEQYMKKVHNYIVSNTNLTLDELNAHYHKQWYLMADEMKEKGLVDVII